MAYVRYWSQDLVMDVLGKKHTVFRFRFRTDE